MNDHLNSVPHWFLCIGIWMILHLCWLDIADYGRRFVEGRGSRLWGAVRILTASALALSWIAMVWTGSWDQYIALSRISMLLVIPQTLSQIRKTRSGS